MCPRIRYDTDTYDAIMVVFGYNTEGTIEIYRGKERERKRKGKNSCY